MSTITERLGIDGETRQLKLGKSFQNHRSNRGPNPSEGLHTIRYDFKPASVDTSKRADLDFGENNKVTVTMSNIESSGLSQTVFKGSRKPHLKECVLIIDNETGELTLERLTHNITVKKTRAEGSSRAGMPRPITPSFEMNQGEKNGKESNRSSPNVSCGSHRSPLVPSIFSSAPSMPLNAALGSAIKTDDDMIGILSESSSDSSDHGSSSSDNSDSSSEDDEIKQSVKEGMKSLKEENSSKAGSSSSSGSDSSSESDEEPDPSPSSVSANNSKPKPSVPNGPSSGSLLPSMPNMLSMPKFSQLSEDLQLSESGSDSD